MACLSPTCHLGSSKTATLQTARITWVCGLLSKPAASKATVVLASKDLRGNLPFVQLQNQIRLATAMLLRRVRSASLGFLSTEGCMDCGFVLADICSQKADRQLE